MQEYPFDLSSAIHDLAAIHANGQLPDLLLAHSQECRKLDLPLDRDLWQPGLDLQAKELGRAASQLFDIPQAHAEQVARAELAQHPRRNIALELLQQYAGHEHTEAEPESVAGTIGETTTSAAIERANRHAIAHRTKQQRRARA